MPWRPAFRPTSELLRRHRMSFTAETATSTCAWELHLQLPWAEPHTPRASSSATAGPQQPHHRLGEVTTGRSDVGQQLPSHRDEPRRLLRIRRLVDRTNWRLGGVAARRHRVTCSPPSWHLGGSQGASSSMCISANCPSPWLVVRHPSRRDSNGIGGGYCYVAGRTITTAGRTLELRNIAACTSGSSSRPGWTSSRRRRRHNGLRAGNGGARPRR